MRTMKRGGLLEAKLVTILLLLAVLVRYGASEDNSAMVIAYKPNGTVVATPNTNVTIFCHTKGYQFWNVNGTVVGYREDEYLSEENGFVFLPGDHDREPNEYNRTVIIPATAMNNNTLVVCVAAGSQSEVTISSPTTLIIVAEKPHPPHHVMLVVMNSTTLRLSWQRPFSRETHPILNYTVRIWDENETMQEELLHMTFVPSGLAEEHFDYYNNESLGMECQQLVFDVRAENDIGKSTSAQIRGGFPIVPGSVSVKAERPTFLHDGTPKVEIGYSLPPLCRPQEASYTITVELAGTVVHKLGPLSYQYQSDATFDDEWVIDHGLKAHETYMVTVVLETVTETSQDIANFSTDHDILVKVDPGLASGISPKGSSLHTPIIVGVSLGVAVTTVVGVILVLLMLTYIRKQRRQTVDARSSGSPEVVKKPLPAMVPNPIYEGPLYETIHEEKPNFDTLPKQNKAQESYYVEIATVRVLDPTAESQEEDSDGLKENNGAAANSDSEYTMMKPAWAVGY